MQKVDDLGKKIEVMKKSHEVELRTLRKTARKAGLDFFKQKSENVMHIFKQEQMFMVEEYYTLKVKDNKKSKELYSLSRLCEKQERTISEMTCFVHDCLDRIFATCSVKHDEIVKSM